MKFVNNLARRHFVSPGILFGLAFVALSPGARAATYNAVDDFSIVSNPNGVWSYVSAGTLLSTSGHNFGGGTTGLDYWWTAEGAPNSEAVIKNITRGPVSILTIVLPPTYLGLEAEGADADLRFTAPSTGTYSFSGNFLGIDTNEQSHPVEILDNGSLIFSGNINTYGQTDAFGLSESLHTGDVLDFESLTGANYFYLSTGLAVTISTGQATAPEPQAYALISAGLAFVAFGIWRKRSQRPA